MLIRNTQARDTDAVMNIYAEARRFMRENGNGSQWGDGHPTRELVEADIINKDGYVVEENGEIVGAFFFKIGEDPTYKVIHGGEWIKDGKYGVIHRIAVKYHGRGIVGFVYNHCYSIINNLRIDTHKNNIPMQRSLEKAGFRYCGIIHIANGDERVAYQKVE